MISTRPQDKTWAQHVVNLVKGKAENAGYTIPLTMTADPGQLPMDDVLQGILLLMGFLGILSLLLSVFLVINTVSAILAQQKRQIGVMKAVGGSTLQILGMYLVMVMLYGVLALLLAVPLGMWRALPQPVRWRSTSTSTWPRPRSRPPRSSCSWPSAWCCLSWPRCFHFISGLRLGAAEAMSSYTMGRGRFGSNWIDRLFSGANVWFTRGLPIRSAAALAQEHIPQQGPAHADVDHPHARFSHLHQRLQRAGFIDQHRRRHDQVVQLRRAGDL